MNFDDLFGDNKAFDDIFGGAFSAPSNLDRDYKEAKKKTNLTLYKMKSGKYRIMDYYHNVVYECSDMVTAKKEFIRIVGC